MEKKLSDPINHSADLSEVLNEWVILCLEKHLKGVRGCGISRPLRPMDEQMWWKCQRSSLTFHLQSVSGHLAAVTPSPLLSITTGRNIIVLTQLDRGRSDDRWGIWRRENHGEKNNKKNQHQINEKLKCGCQTNTSVLSDNMNPHWQQTVQHWMWFSAEGQCMCRSFTYFLKCYV